MKTRGAPPHPCAGTTRFEKERNEEPGNCSTLPTPVVYAGFLYSARIWDKAWQPSFAKQGFRVYVLDKTQFPA